jgi:putative transposase
MMYPLVLDLADDGVPVTVTCRVLGFSTQGFYKWRKTPLTQRDWDDAHLINAARDIHADDPAFGYRFIADELPERGIVAGENRVARLCSEERIWSIFAKKRGLNRIRTPGSRRPRRSPIPRPGRQRGLADRHHRTPHRRGQALPLRHQGRVLQQNRRVLLGFADEGVPGGGRVASCRRRPITRRDDRALRPR